MQEYYKIHDMAVFFVQDIIGINCYNGTNSRGSEAWPLTFILCNNAMPPHLYGIIASNTPELCQEIV